MNDIVYALAVSGDTVYVGGGFTRIGGEDRSHIAALDADSGEATEWDPDADRDVYALAVSGDTVYVGGGFTRIGGEDRSHIAALDADSGEATEWDLDSAHRDVCALAVSGDTVYVGGVHRHRRPGSQPYRRPRRGHWRGQRWDPGANSYVYALAVSGDTVYVGGWLPASAAKTATASPALDAASGGRTDWNPDASGPVLALALSTDTVYVGGWFTNIGGQDRSCIAALDATSGACHLESVSGQRSLRPRRLRRHRLRGRRVLDGGRRSAEQHRRSR